MWSGHTLPSPDLTTSQMIEGRLSFLFIFLGYKGYKEFISIERIQKEKTELNSKLFELILKAILHRTLLSGHFFPYPSMKLQIARAIIGAFGRVCKRGTLWVGHTS